MSEENPNLENQLPQPDQKLLAPYNQPRCDGRTDNDRPQGDRPDPLQRKTILEKLDALAGANFLGVVPVQRVNAGRAIYNTMLTHLDESPATSVTLPNEDVLETMRTSPTAFKVITPFLTKEQLDLVGREAGSE